MKLNPKTALFIGKETNNNVSKETVRITDIDTKTSNLSNENEKSSSRLIVDEKKTLDPKDKDANKVEIVEIKNKDEKMIEKTKEQPITTTTTTTTNEKEKEKEKEEEEKALKATTTTIVGPLNDIKSDHLLSGADGSRNGRFVAHAEQFANFAQRTTQPLDDAKTLQLFTTKNQDSTEFKVSCHKSQSLTTLILPRFVFVDIYYQ
jgi:hypothetical protein